MKNITPIEFKNQIESDTNAVIIDCRTAIEWDEGIIKNSILLDLYDAHSFMQESEKLDKDKNYLHLLYFLLFRDQRTDLCSSLN